MQELNVCPVPFEITTMPHIVSWNIKGLNAPIKRSMCLDWLRRHKIDVAFIQESHFKHYYYYYTSAAATFSSKSRGALVVLRRSPSLTIIGSYGSEDGRITLKQIYMDRKLHFYVYMPLITLAQSSLAQLAKLYVTCRTFQLLLALT